jgi:hypothetical protein
MNCIMIKKENGTVTITTSKHWILITNLTANNNAITHVILVTIQCIIIAKHVKIPCKE